MNLLRVVDNGRGSEALFRDQLPGLLTVLAHRARVASITASSAIEGVVVSDARRAGEILSGQARRLRTRSEQELAGYRDALDYLFTQDWHPLNVGLLLHLHRLLFAHTAIAGGVLKSEDNLVVDRAADGEISVRFRPVPAVETEFYLHELVDRYEKALLADGHHPVLLVGLFALDFSIIHPFADGNGRVARAMTNGLLLSQGYTVCRYVSLEQQIAESADAYYAALLESTTGWHSDDADPWPWLTYFVGLLADAYRVFGERAASGQEAGSKQERVRAHVLRHAPEAFRISDLRTALPGISDPTIRLVLDQLRQEGRLHATGTGRGATWRRAEEPQRRSG